MDLLPMRELRCSCPAYGIVPLLIVWLWLLDLALAVAQGAVNSHTTAPPPLLFVTTRDIRLANASRGSPKPRVQILVKNLTEGIALDFHYAARKLCWTDHGLEMIQCVSYDGGEVGDKVEVVSSGLISPDGLACDWVTDKLYWTDGETNRIEVATMNGEHRKVLFWSDIDQPRAIALAPARGLVFWTDWGEVPKIERAGMNGDPRTRKVIVSEDIFWPNGLTLDYERELVYWLDGKLKFIAVMDYDGGNRQRVASKGLVYPFAITHFRDRFYFTDWQTWCVYAHDLDSPQAPRELIHSESCPMDIHVWAAGRQPPAPNPCGTDNGGCSHLCLLAPDPPGYSCACPVGIRLLDERTCAPGPQELLLLAIRTDICLIYLDSLDHTHRVLPLAGVRYAIAVDYDPGQGHIYWTDDEVKAIRRARLNGSEQMDVVRADVHHPDGLAVDWVAGNLYWTDTGTDRIEVTRLDGRYRRVLLHEGLAEPRAIAVAPEHGWMFWSDWNERQPKIERAALDGSERRVIVNGSLGWPNGVTLDLERSKIYWCDAKFDKIETANMDGSERIVLTGDNVPHPFGLSLMGDFLYWTDWQRRSIDRVHKVTGAGRETITDQMPNVMGLKAIRLGAAEYSNPCARNNGGCAHLCLNRPGGRYVCACQMAYELRDDRKTCVLPDSFLLFATNESIGRISIENARADGEEENDATIPVSGVKLASSVDFDMANMRMYWSDVKARAIFRAFVNGSDTQKVVELGVRSPEGMAVDWLAQNVYWADPAAARIEVARLDGSSRRVLLWRGLSEPRGVALDPARGFMYWSEWGAAQRVARAFMDGQRRQPLAEHAEQARALAVDHVDGRVCWIEGNATPTVQCCRPDGSERTAVVTGLQRPAGLTAYGGALYWAEARTGEVFRAREPQYMRERIHSHLSGVTDLAVVHADRRRQSNQCSSGNGGCSHLCLAVPSGRTCACPTHYAPLNGSCSPPRAFMVYSQRGQAVRLVPDSADCPEAVLPVQGLKNVRAVHFDPAARHLYWIEGKTHAIKRAPDDGSAAPSLVVAGGQDRRGGPYDLAVDPLGRLLFWTCSARDAINVTRLDNGSSVGVVVRRDGEKPRLLALHPVRRLLFWTDVGDQPQLVRARLDGSHRIVIKSLRGGQNVSALALDLDSDTVAWAEGSRLFVCNIDGENQFSPFPSDSRGGVMQLAAHAGSLWWLERGQPQLLRKFELRSARHDSLRLSHPGQVTDLVSVRQPVIAHSCAQQQQRCSHICLGDGEQLVCACPQGLALQDDRRSCAAVPDCGKDFWTCGREHALSSPSGDCIPAAWRCDGQTDCHDGSDESGCPACRADQFRCLSGQCIERAWLCDGSAHCPDGQDEARCCRQDDEFKCPETDVCIPAAALCDGHEHCANGTDESAAVCEARRAAGGDRGNLPARESRPATYAALVLAAASGALLLPLLLYYAHRRCAKRRGTSPRGDPATDPLSPKPGARKAGTRSAKPVPDVVHMSMLAELGAETDGPGYERCHVTGASSSTNGSSVACYPRETLNPPPSPATTANSTRDSSPTARYRPYRHYRAINQPPPPTPCSTDVCDESDCNYGVARGPFPPPPTPRSHCHSESCPPSPSSRSSTYFSPLPPPPSPVP